MSGDMFDNLEEWGVVLEQIAELRKSRKLDENQEGLARILRYRDNWRLREAVLESIRDLRVPSDEIVSAMVDIMMNGTLYSEVRIMAAESLSSLLKKYGEGGRNVPSISASRIIEKMNMILDSPQPPFVHEAIGRCLRAVQKTE